MTYKLDKKSVLDGIPLNSGHCGWTKSLQKDGLKVDWVTYVKICVNRNTKFNTPGTLKRALVEFDDLKRFDFKGKLAYYEKWKDLEVEFK